MKRNKILLSDYCSPPLREFGESLYSLDGAYPVNYLRLFASCASYGSEMLSEGKKQGILALMGNPKELEKTIGKTQRLGDKICEELIQKYGKRILLNPIKTQELIREVGKIGDGAVFFDSYGNLMKVKQFINKPDIDEVNGELGIVMKIKDKKDNSIGTKHLSALYATKLYSVKAVATSEEDKHTTMAFKNGRIVRKLVFDPSTGYYGLDLMRHLEEKIRGDENVCEN